MKLWNFAILCLTGAVAFGAEAKLFDLDTGKTYKLFYNRSWSGHGKIQGIIFDGKMVSGEYKTIRDTSGNQQGSAVLSGEVS